MSRLAIIKLIQNNPGITRMEIASRIGIAPMNVTRHLLAIERNNCLMMKDDGDYVVIEHYNLVKHKLTSRSPYQYVISK